MAIQYILKCDIFIVSGLLCKTPFLHKVCREWIWDRLGFKNKSWSNVFSECTCKFQVWFRSHLKWKYEEHSWKVWLGQRKNIHMFTRVYMLLPSCTMPFELDVSERHECPSREYQIDSQMFHPFLIPSVLG